MSISIMIHQLYTPPSNTLLYKAKFTIFYNFWTKHTFHLSVMYYAVHVNAGRSWHSILTTLLEFIRRVRELDYLFVIQLKLCLNLNTSDGCFGSSMWRESAGLRNHWEIDDGKRKRLSRSVKEWALGADDECHQQLGGCSGTLDGRISRHSGL